MRFRKIIMLFGAGLLLCGCADSKSGCFEQAEKQLANKEYEAALEQYNKAIMEDEQLQLSYRGVAIASLRTGDYVKAEEYLLRALKMSEGKIGETELDLANYLTDIQMKQQKYDEVIKTCDSILSFDKNSTNALVKKGMAYACQKKPDKAEKCFDQAIKQESNNISVYNNCYEALRAEGYQEEGKKYLEKGTKCTAQTREEKYVLGKLYVSLGDMDKARELLEESRKEGFSGASFYLGRVYEEALDLSSAMTCYEEYITTSNLTLSEYDKIASCKMKQGDYAGAIKLYSDAADGSSGTRHQKLWFGKICIMEKSGDFSGAKKEMESFLLEYPQDEQAQREYKFLCQ